MENIRHFLESSSVHGLSYISSTRKIVKLFWIIVVISGFTGAAFIIYESFQAWEESPITTTIETRPISEITFPKVTVCPPKNTYTDLNYDLMMTENMTLDNDTRNELTNFVVELLYDEQYDKVTSNLNKMEDIDICCKEYLLFLGATGKEKYHMCIKQYDKTERSFFLAKQLLSPSALSD